MPISTNRRQLEKDKFVDDGGGDVAVRVKLVSGGGSPAIPGTYYVAASADVTGTRDGSPSAPYANLDFMATEPTTQAEYDEVKIVRILDTETYALPSTVAMGQWTIDVGAGFLEDASGGTDWEIDSNLRFGSSNAPTFYVQRNNNIISTAWTGDGFRAVLKSGGSAVSLLRMAVSGSLRSGDITIADGTNAGTSCASLPIFSMYRASFDATGTFRGRLALVSLVQATLSSTGDLEVGYFTGIQNTTISSLNVLESRASTTTKTIRDLILNTSGGVTWTTSTRNWDVDAPSADEVLSKITSYPSATINLTRVESQAIDYSNGLDMENGNIENADAVFLDRLRIANEEVLVSTLNVKDTTHAMVLVPYTSTGAVTINLPALDGLTDEMTIWIKDTGQNAGTNNITIVPDAGSGDTIEGVGSYVMDSDGQGLMLYANRTNQNWSVN